MKQNNGRSLMSALVLCMFNQKGGVGKSSTVFHLGGHFSKVEGWRVLVCDMDPQASLTQGFFGQPIVDSLAEEDSIAALFGDNNDLSFSITRLVRPTGFDRLSIIPGSHYLHRFNVPEPKKAGLHQVVLRDSLADLKDDYDLILLDCPPNPYLCAWASLVASDFVIVPFQPEDYGCQGIKKMNQTIADVLAQANENIRLVGYLLTMVRRAGLHVAFEKELRAIYGDKLFKVVVPEAIDFPMSIASRQPVSYFKPRSAASKVMKVLADEFVNRVAQMKASEFGGAGLTAEQAA
jgi:chromosome partitioning protein